MAGLDVIGDVHGQAEMLEDLLTEMGYGCRDRVWSHPDRTAVFIGDLIDRNPGQLAVIRIARAMAEAGKAHVLMGNHEFNAIAWATADPERPGQYRREHSAKNRAQHEAFLAEVGEGSDLHREIVEWFKTLPLWLDLGAARFVHACWDPRAMKAIAPRLGPSNTLTDELLSAAAAKPRLHTPRADRAAYRAIEHLLKGPEVRLPKGYEYLDKGGHPRKHARFAWWHEDPTVYSRGGVIPDGTTRLDGTEHPGLPHTRIPRLPVRRYEAEVPLFVGHYWSTGTPSVLSPHVACVDYSAGKSGPLVAYRWSGESTLTDDNFVSVPSRMPA